MFTPPPSPRPAANPRVAQPSTSVRPNGSRRLPRPPPSEDEIKRRTGRRFRVAVIFIPLLLITIAASSRLLLHQGTTSHPFTLPTTIPWYQFLPEGSRWRPLEKRDPNPEPQTQKQSTASASSSTSTSTGAAPSSASSTIPVASRPVPTVPSAPPILPTPFPQPFDGTLAQNFSSMSCLNFLTNMTNTAPFRSCRPFSLLMQSSDDFITAQQNLTLLNSIVWGMCNTNTAEDQCTSNMGWFASNLKTSCVQDLRDQNAMAVSTLQGLQAYTVMRDAACLTDPTTNTYCFLNAARSSNPSDLYYYSLPLGLKLPKTATPSCSACTKSVMGIFASAVKDKLQAQALTGLQATYDNAADLSVGLCGAGYAQINLVNGAISARWNGQEVVGLNILLLAMVSWTLFGHFI